MSDQTFQAVINGHTRTIAVVETPPEVARKAKELHDKTYENALRLGLPSSTDAIEHLRKRGLWGDDKEERLAELDELISEKEFTLTNKTTDAEAKPIAERLRELRKQRLRLLADLHEYDQKTAEARAQQVWFETVLVGSVVEAESKRPIFRGRDDYLSRADEPGVEDVARKFSHILFGVKPFVEEQYLN